MSWNLPSFSSASIHGTVISSIFHECGSTKCINSFTRFEPLSFFLVTKWLKAIILFYMLRIIESNRFSLGKFTYFQFLEKNIFLKLSVTSFTSTTFSCYHVSFLRISNALIALFINFSSIGSDTLLARNALERR